MKKILIALLLMFSITTIKTFSQDVIKQRTINVTGTAELEVVPNEIYVAIELREYDKKGGGKTDIDAIKTDFIKAALSVGIADSNISVQSYQGWDGNYWLYKKNKKKNPDLKASITYQVKLSGTKKMDELVQKLDDEATQNFYISTVSHSGLEDFKKDLKIKAVQAAKDKANYLAAAIDEKVGEALTINDPSEVGVVYPMQMNRMMFKSEAPNAGQQEPNIDFKKIKLQYQVNVIFALK